MATEKESHFEFQAPKFVVPLDILASQDQDCADAFFDADTSLRHESGMKTPERLSSLETFMTPAETAKKLGGNTRQQEELDCTLEDEENKENEQTLVEESLEKPNEIEELPTQLSESEPKKEESNIVLESIQETEEPHEKPKRERRLIRKPLKRFSLPSPNTPNLDHPETTFSEALENLRMKPLQKKVFIKTPQKFDGIELEVSEGEGKVHGMETRRDKFLRTPTYNLRNRQAVRRALKRKASPELDLDHKRKYMTMAEYMMHFHKDTPPRFHTSNKQFEEKVGSKGPKVTIPMSPALVTKTRARPSTAPDPQKRTEMELEDIKKHQVKPCALNEKILEPGWKVNLPKSKPKSSTVPEPFKLTEVIKKEVEDSNKDEPFKFKAKPVPRSAYQGTSRRKYKVNMLTVEEGEVLVTEANTTIGLYPIERRNKRRSVQAFSSYDRSLEMLRKKEEKIKKVLEEEKKAREFHANPLPSYLNRKRNANSTIDSLSSTMSSTISSRMDSISSEVDENKPFKAKPPVVLYKKPFEVKKAERPLIEPNDIKLHTERRAKDREDFDSKLKQKEEQRQEIIKQREEKNKEKEREEIMRLRKELVHKATPLPPFVHSSESHQGEKIPT